MVVSMIALAGCGGEDTDVDNSPDAQLAQAQEAYHQDQFGMALERVDRIIEQHDDFTAGYLFKARVHHQLDSADQALEAVNRAIELDAESSNAHLDRAIYLRSLDRPDRAEASLVAAEALALARVERGPFDIDAKLCLAMIAHLRGYVRSALDQVNVILADRPRSNKARALKAMLEQEMDIASAGSGP